MPLASQFLMETKKASNRWDDHSKQRANTLQKRVKKKKIVSVPVVCRLAKSNDEACINKLLENIKMEPNLSKNTPEIHEIHQKYVI